MLDARRCISYLTIELKGPIPVELRPKLGNWIFGCDLCQIVCPYNRRFARPARLAAFQPRPDSAAPRLLDLLAVDDASFRRRFRNSPVKRAKRRGLLRNVCIALGNWGDPSAVPALVEALNDIEPLIRGHAAWALGQIGQKAEVRGQKAEVRSQRSEVGGQRAEGRTQITEIDGLIRETLEARYALETDSFVQGEITRVLAPVHPKNHSNASR